VISIVESSTRLELRQQVGTLASLRQCVAFGGVAGLSSAVAAGIPHLAEAIRWIRPGCVIVGLGYAGSCLSALSLTAGSSLVLDRARGRGRLVQSHIARSDAVIPFPLAAVRGVAIQESRDWNKRPIFGLVLVMSGGRLLTTMAAPAPDRLLCLNRREQLRRFLDVPAIRLPAAA
jgi:hypothetical protein